MTRDKSYEWNSTPTLSRYNVRSNVDVNITPTTLFRINIGGYLQDRHRTSESFDNIFSEAFNTPPHWHPAIYSNGKIPKVKNRTNPWALTTQTGYADYSDSKIESLFTLEQDLKFILPGLKAKGTFSFDRSQSSWIVRSKRPDYYSPATSRDENGNLNLVISEYGQEYLGYEKDSDFGRKSTYLEWLLSYDQTFGKHIVSGMFMYNQRHLNTGDKLPFRFQGIAGRLSYTYDNRYITEFNFGYNGSENFAKGHRFGFFPSVAAGWVISEEDFMKKTQDVISNLKIRASWGLVGNDQLGSRFPYLTTIGDTGDYTWGVDNNYHRAGRWEGLVGSNSLTWEKVKKFDVGLELGLWNAIDFTIDYFSDHRYDIFMQRTNIPSSAGFIQMPYANYGKANNKGVEMSLSINKQVSKDLSVMVRGTLTYAKSEITEMDEPSGIRGTNRARTGQPINQIFGLIDDGLFTNDDFADVENGVLKEGVPVPTFNDKVRPGDIKYVDVNKDGKIDYLDESAIGGTVDPQLVYGFGANIQYKQFDFGFFFQGNGKTYRLIGGPDFIPGSGSGMANIYDNYKDHWTEDNPSQNVFWPRLSSSKNENNIHPSTWWLKDMSMLRLKNIELGYSFSKQHLLPSFIQRARVFVTGNNLLQFSKFKMWDPEIGASNGLRYPIMKSVAVGFDINF